MNPFVAWADFTASPLVAPSEGPLSGVRLAVKDIIDVGGYLTGGGNPTWLEQQAPAVRDADAVAVLRGAGAVVVGKTHTDELAYSLAGSNAHYGDLDNPRAPGRTPGGSSSGSAVAVASGMADLGLGTDTAGSIRVPAAWGGLYGLRPTWGRVSTRGVMALGPTHDTVGLLARELPLLATAAGLLLRWGADATEPLGFLVPEDLWAQADDSVVDALRPALSQLEQVLPVDTVSALLTTPPRAIVETFTITQGAQVWETHGGWVRTHKPAIGPDVAARMSAAAALPAETVADARALAAVIRAQLAEVLQGRIMLLPTVPVTAPTPAEARTPDVRDRLLTLTVPASIGGLPALTVPVEGEDGLPVGLCLVGPPGADHQLLALAAAAAAG